MSLDEPFALLITWTCYGQWLPGDPRGYVSNTLTDDGYRPKRNVLGTVCDRDHAATHQRAKQLQKQSTVWLTPAQARVAAEAMTSAARKRGWLILRGAVMANHVHIVIAECPDDGPAVRRVLKGVSQAALSHAIGTPRTWWTTGGSDRHKHGHSAVEMALRYVAEQEYPLVQILNNEIVAVTGRPRG